MKKKIIILSLVLLLSTAIGGTLALSTSVEDDTNVLTTGRVDIKQHEYERVQNAKGEYVSTQVTDRYGYVPDKIKPFTQGKDIEPAYYVDGKVKWDDRNGSSAATGSESHQQSWLQAGAEGSNQLFDSSVRNVIDKFVFVENVGRTNAYYRTIIALECPEGFDASLIHINVNGNSRFKWDNLGYVNISGTRYYLKVATYKEVLTPGETSRPSLLQVYLDPKTTNADMDLLGKSFDILVKTQATQAISGVDSSTVLDDAFGNIIENLPWDEVVIPKMIKTKEELIEFLSAGGSAILGANITIDSSYMDGQVFNGAKGKEINLNTNGYKIINETKTELKTNYFMVFGKDSNVKLTGSGEVVTTGESISGQNNLLLNAIANSKLTIDGGTYNVLGSTTGLKNNVAIYAAGQAEVIVNDGNFYTTGELTSLVNVAGSAKVYIRGGFFKSEGYANQETLNVEANSPEAAIIISGGTFVNFDPSKEDKNQGSQIKIETGYKVVKETQSNGETWYTVVPE